MRANDPYEQLISQMIQIERQPQFTMEAQKRTQERTKAVLSDFDSTLSALHTRLETFTDLFSNPFDGRSATLAADENAYKVSASDDSAFGSHTLKVDRLATADARISQQYTSSGTSLRTFFDTNGEQTFSINVSNPTEGDPNNREAISVTINPTGTTDEEILDEISAAINTAMTDAVDAETISDSQTSNASVVKETTSTARLSLRAGETGYNNRLEFTDSANGLLSLLEVNSASVASGTNGGQVTAVGTSETDSELNSRFVLDGLTLYRDTNQVTDALTGTTINLQQVSTAASEFNVAPDSDTIVDEVKSFITQYNDVLSFIEGRTSVDGATGTRGIFAGDSTFTGLRLNMRTDAVRSVTGQPTDGPQALTDLGITIENDGTLTLEDEDALLAAVEQNGDAVKTLFAADDGVANRLKTRLDEYLGVNGIIDNRQDAIDERVNRLDDRIDAFDFRLQIREDQLRAQFAQLQETVAVVQGQSASISNFFFGGGGGF